MKRIFRIVVTTLIVLMVVVFGIRNYHIQKMVSMIVMVPEQPSPLDSLPIQKEEIHLDNRVLVAHFLSYDESAPAVFICTGNGEALYEWLPVQKYFLDHGFSSYVFSYSGFGNSTGKPTSKSLYEDAQAAYEQYRSLTPKASAHIGLSHSLGGTPLLGITHKVNPPFDKIVVHAAFANLRELLIDLHEMSPAFKWLWPNIMNNVADAKKITIPTLYVASKDDQTVPYTHSEELASNTKNATLRLNSGYGHNAIYQNVADSLYRPILEFMRK